MFSFVCFCTAHHAPHKIVLERLGERNRSIRLVRFAVNTKRTACSYDTTILIVSGLIIGLKIPTSSCNSSIVCRPIRENGLDRSKSINRHLSSSTTRSQQLNGAVDKIFIGRNVAKRNVLGAAIADVVEFCTKLLCDRSCLHFTCVCQRRSRLVCLTIHAVCAAERNDATILIVSGLIVGLKIPTSSCNSSIVCRPIRENGLDRSKSINRHLSSSTTRSQQLNGAVDKIFIGRNVAKRHRVSITTNWHERIAYVVELSIKRLVLVADNGREMGGCREDALGCTSLVKRMCSQVQGDMSDFGENLRPRRRVLLLRDESLRPIPL